MDKNIPVVTVEALRSAEHEVRDLRGTVVGLPDLSADDYREKDNPLAFALSALMKPSHLGRVLQKILSLQRILQSSVDKARQSLLAYVIETYLRLSEAEAEAYRQIATEEDVEEISTMLTVEDVQNLIERIGESKGRRKALLSLMSRKFGALPENITKRIEEQDTDEEVERLLMKILDANSLQEMGLTEN